MKGKVVCEIELFGVLRGVGVDQLAEHGQTASATLGPPIRGKDLAKEAPHDMEEPNGGDHVLQPVFG